jgi:TonB-linked SusC/RagA family outer membrane protein
MRMFGLCTRVWAVHQRLIPWLAVVSIGAVTSLLGPTANAQTGVVIGRVVDASSKAPVPSAEVRVVNTTIGAPTGSDGRYRIQGVPAGSVQVRAVRLGFAPQVQTVTVPAGDTVTADFALGATQVTLDQVVVTATGETERERETGNAVSLVQADSVNKAAVSTFTELLTAKAPGVQVQQTSGTVGGGSRIRIRGNNSISLPNDPLLVIDGVYVNNNPGSSVQKSLTGGQESSRFDDLNPDDIENIEVLKGPAASALYGTAGANGVVLVTTKHGTSGHPQWNAHADYGPQTNYYNFPANHDVVGSSPGGPVDHCTLVFVAEGVCTQTPGSAKAFNPLENPATTPFVTGSRTLFGGSVSGGNPSTRYYVSGDYDSEHGVYVNNFDTRNNVRANLQASPSSNFDLSINAGYLQGRGQLPQNDNNLFSPILNGVLGPANGNPPTFGNLFFPASVTNQIQTAESIDRVTGSATGTWRPISWLTITGVGGLDFNQRTDRNIIPANLVTIFGPLTASGFAETAPYSIYLYTTQATATATYSLAPSLRATTSVGTQYTNQIERGTTGQGFGLASGTTSLAGAVNQFSVSDVDQQAVTVGFYGQEQLQWREKVYLTGALREDNNSGFGRNLGYQAYPSVSASWVVGEEPWFPKSAVVSSLRLRSAYGFSGQHPGFQQAQTFYNSTAYHIPGFGEVGGVTVGGFGNSNLKPERSGEFEAGFDAGLFNDRFQLTVTGYNKVTRDALILVNLPPSVGGITTGGNFGTSTRYQNLGEVTNSGFEVQLTSTIIDARDFGADLTVNGSFNRNRVVSLGPGVAPIIFGLSTVNGGFIQRQIAGYPLGGFWQNSFTYSDANHDGIIEPNEVTLAANASYHGNPFPETEWTLGPSVTVFRYFRIGALFDFHGTVYNWNATENQRCTSVGGTANCYSAYFANAPLAFQARNVADFLGTDAGFIENASFWKWRELTITATAPNSWAHAFHLRALSATLGGHNLHTWTPFTGLDPEVTFFGQDNFITTNFFTQPLLTYWTGRINVTF